MDNLVNILLVDDDDSLLFADAVKEINSVLLCEDVKSTVQMGARYFFSKPDDFTTLQEELVKILTLYKATTGA